MKGSMSTDLGIITIDPEVIAKYAGSVAVETFEKRKPYKGNPGRNL